MFYNCCNLESLDLSSFNTQNVTNMKGMFLSCKKLQNLDLSSFNTQKVINMSGMFDNTHLKRVVVNVQDNNLISQTKGKSFEIIYA